MSNVKPEHKSVLLEEVVKYALPENGKTFVDGTFGLGGHTRAILKAYPFFNLNVKQSPVGQISPNLIDIYTYTYQKSFIQFTESEPDYYLDVMSGDIIDERIVLKNSIHIGLIKEDVFKILGIQCDHLSDINTIEFICTLDGYWQYYTFANDTLRRILIESR